MSYTVTEQPGAHPETLILRPDGPLTTSVLPQFGAAVKAAAGKRLVLDLGGIPHMDSAGLGALLTLHTSLQKEGRTLVLAHPQKRVEMLISLTKADTVLSIFPTVEAAEHA